MPLKSPLSISCLAIVAFGVSEQAVASDSNAAPSLTATPQQLTFTVPESSSQILVGATSAGKTVDLTHSASYSSQDPQVARVNERGQVVPVADGQTQIVIQSGEATLTVPVSIQGLSQPAPISFQNEIVPILSKASCNSGGCHGKAEGQNGFKLSVFGYDPAFDHQAIVLESRGRRVNLAAPEKSLLLAKGAAATPHGGGQKFSSDSRWHARIHRWIAEGAQLDAPQTGVVETLVVTPSEVVLAPQGQQQLRVTLRSPDGTERCVTAEADFLSNQDSIAGVDHEGFVQATDVPGEAAILVRYLGQVATCRVVRPRMAGEFTRPPEINFIDTLVWNKLDQLNVSPSEVCDDATYLRRASLDVIGTLPTAEEAREFITDSSPDKRQRLIDRLLQRSEYADYWTQRWSDLLRVDKDVIEPQGAVAMTNWIHNQLERNVPFDEFVHAILIAKGPTWGNSPSAFFQVQKDPEMAARAVSQLFLGVRIECAQCHHHPFERWDQSDYYAFAGMFTGIDRKKDPRNGMKIIPIPGKDLTHPRTGELVAAAGLGSGPPEFPEGASRRGELADWVTSPENPYFAKSITNRLWAHYFGRGLVDPLDDFRATNPASNEPLLDALASHLIELDFDIRKFTTTLLTSRVYQLSAVTNESNALDDQNFSHAAWKPLPAEVLLDAISQATGVPEEFNGWPVGYRAIQIWDNKLPSHFFDVFGRPSRLTVCSCERGVEPSIAQALHLMNSAETMDKVMNRRGRAAELANSSLTVDDMITELYLTTLTRFPSEQELVLMRSAFEESKDRHEVTEDILWTLLNTREFVFNH